MGVRIDAAGHDVAAGGVQGLVAGEVLPDFDDDIALDPDIGLVGQVRRDDGAVFDDLAAHFLLTPLVSNSLRSRVRGFTSGACIYLASSMPVTCLRPVLTSAPLPGCRCRGMAPSGRYHSTISAVSSTAWNSTSAPAAAHSREMSSASLWLNPSTHGHMIMVDGATRLVQQAS